jgi:D-sedoheptulose 7-phosphate isomerase
MDQTELRRIVSESLELKRGFFDKEAGRLIEAGHLLSGALRAGRKILAFGNGGSAADAQHFAAELVNRFTFDRPALRAVALTTDSSVLTSIANDSEFRFVFSRQIEALGTAGDVGLAISTSGDSENVLEGVAACRDRGMRTVGLIGRDGGQLSSQVELCLIVPHRATARIQEVHAMVIHLLCQMIEEELFREPR